MANIISILQKRAIKQPKLPAYLSIDADTQEASQITYEELDQKARTIAAYLQEKNLFGQRVLLLYPAGLDFIAAFMGCAYAGVIAVPAYLPKHSDSAKSKSSLIAIAENAEISGILTIADYLDQVQAVFASQPIFIEASDKLNTDLSTKYTMPQITDETIVYLQYTSGSTSTPKAVIIRHSSLLHNLIYSAKAWHYSYDSVTLTWTPHAHVFGLVCGLLVPLYNGTLSVIMSPQAVVRRPGAWLEAISQYRVTHTGCPNFGYELCIQDIKEDELAKLNLKNWKVAINGGELVNYETLIKFSQKFASCGFSINKFCSAYGMSELTGTIAATKFGKKPKYLALTIDGLSNNDVILAKNNISSHKFMSSGKLIKGIEAIIVDPETLQPSEKGKIGEIWLRGKSLASGYWHYLEDTQEIFYAKLKNSSRYCRTGDLGFIKNKELFLTGRVKEVIVIHGKKYYPADIEVAPQNSLKAFDLGKSHVVFSVPNVNKEQVIYLQEIKSQLELDVQDEIIAIIRKEIAKQFHIDLDEVILVEDNTLPKTASGKLQRNACKKNYLENKLYICRKKSDQKSGRIIEQSRSPIMQVFQKDLIRILSDILHIDKSNINLTNNISEYNFDSINIEKFVSSLNEKYDLNITPDILYEYSTLNEFVNNLLENNKSQLHNYYRVDSAESLYEVRISPEKASEEKWIDNLHGEIAIIGMSGLFPGAQNTEELWENLLNGHDAIKEVPKERWDWQAFYGDPVLEEHKTKIKWGGFVDSIAEFDADFFNISPREAELTDPQQRIFLQVVWKAIEDAGYTPNDLAKLNTGLFVGVFNNDYAELLQKQDIIDAYITTGITHSILANRISYLLNLHGPSVAIDTACSSSLVAMHHAVQAIHNGDCNVAIVGGVNALLTPTTYLVSNKAGMLSEDGHCKTFDKSANGYVRAEGTAAIILKSLSQAKADGDHIYAIIKGTAVNHGGHVSSLTVPNPNAQAEVIISACQRANVPINTINYIETHGTGTALGDPVEINGLKKAFSQLAEKQNITLPTGYCGLGAVKTHVGHLEAAAGITGVIKVLLALKHKILPGNLHFEELNPYIDINNSPFYIINRTQDWVKTKDTKGNDLPRRAGISSFGFGGTNSHIIIEEFVENETNNTDKASNKLYLLALSAKTESALQHRINDLSKWLSRNTDIELEALSYTLNLGRMHFNMRCAFVVSSIDELREALNSIINDNDSEKFIVNHDRHAKVKINFYYDQLVKTLIHEITSEDTLSMHEYKNKMYALGNFYVEGYDLDWKQLHKGKIKRISLPTYEFTTKHYWIPDLKDNPNPQTQTIDFPESTLLSHIQHDFVEIISSLLKIDTSKISLNSALTELGFDSISFKELAVKLENYFNIELSPTLFFTYNDVNSISQYLLETYSNKMIQLYDQHLPQKNISSPSSMVTTASTHASTEEDLIAIIGMQGMLPKSKNLNEFWEQLISGSDMVDVIPTDRWDWEAYYGDSTNQSNKTNSKWGGCIPEFDQFDASFFNISSREANLMDPQQRLFLEIVWKTIEDAGYNPLDFSGQNVGIFAGVEFNEYQAAMNNIQKIFHGHVATGNSHALLANRVSYFLNLHGPSEVIDTACSSSLVAIHRAVNAIQNGECSLAVAGGVSLMLNPDTFIVTSQLGALSSDGRCKTFDKEANGYVKGEGVAAILLKPLSQAKKDHDHIYGIIKSSVVNHGGRAQSLTAPNAVAQAQLLVNAYTKANVDPRTVTYIETHGTGTELGDPIEIEGLKQAFKTLLTNKNISFSEAYCGLGSVKSNIGHLEPASGIAGIIKVLLAMQNGKLPKNLHLNELNPYIDLKNSPFYIIDQTQDWKRLQSEMGAEVPRRAGVSSFGFGGTNAHIVLEENAERENSLTQSKPCYLIALSAKQEQSLKQKLIDLQTWLISNKSVNLESLSYTLNVGRSHFNFRCGLVVRSIDELINSLSALIENQKIKNGILNSMKVDDPNTPLYTEIYKSTLPAIKNATKLTPEEYYEKLILLADLYTKNYPIDWDVVHHQERKHRLGMLPGYPFVKQRYWFDAEFNFVKDLPQKEIKDTNIGNVNQSINLTEWTVNYLQEIFAEKLRLTKTQINSNATYEVYGVDSLLGIEIAKRLEQDFGNLSKTLLYEKNTIHDLALYLQKKYADKLQTMAQIISVPTAMKPIEVIKSVTKEQNIQHHHEDIAIIGLNGIFPLANNINEFWENLINARDCVGEIPIERWNYKDYPIQVGDEQKYYKWGGFINDIDKFDALFFNIAPREASLMDPQERLFLQSAWATLEDAGYTRKLLEQNANNNVGVFAGVTYNFYPLFVADEWNKGNRLPLDIQMFSVANRISYFLNFNGPSYVVDTACSSSLSAIHLACESIQRGECMMALAGGVNLSLHPSKYHFLGSYGFMSEQGRCASFAEGGAGYVPGEGVGCVLLKPLSLAQRDNDRIYGVIKASAMNHGGKTSGYTVPNPNAQAELVSKALRKANIDARSISYVEAHGTGTALGDPIEIRGLQEAFEQDTQEKQFCAIGSVKSNIGHLESAAGVSQLAKVLLQMQHKKLVPSIHSEKINPFIEFAQTPFYVQHELSDWKVFNNNPRRAGISSFGAGGTNVHIIVEEYSAEPKNYHKTTSHSLFLLSAMNEERLREYAKNVYVYLEKEKSSQSDDQLNTWLKEICYTTQVGREAMSARLAIIAKNFNELLEKLKSFIENSSAKISQTWLNFSVQNKASNKDISELMKQAHYEPLAEEWINGVNISWEEMYQQEIPNKTYIPTYPFAKRRCWVPSQNNTSIPSSLPETIPEAELSMPPLAISDWLYTIQWTPKSIENKLNAISEKDQWLIFSDKELGFLLQEELGKTSCTYCFESDHFVQSNKNIYYINPNRFKDYCELFSRIYEDKNTNFKGIIYLWSFAEDSQNFQANTKLLYLFQAVIRQNWQNKINFCLVTRGAQRIHNADVTQIWQHYLWSLTRIFVAEQGNFQALLLDLPNEVELRIDALTIANEIKQYKANENSIAFREGKRYVPQFTQLDQHINTSPWVAPKAAIITGGLGALGIEVAKWLAKQGTRYLLLTGLTELPDKSEWKSVQEPSLQEKIKNLESIADLGPEIFYASADVTNKKGMEQLINKTQQEWKTPIEGVFHLAGITTDSIKIENMTQEIFEHVLATKIQGAMVLNEIFNKPDLSCFVLFSSIAALPFFGMSGLSAYAMANAFLDGLAHYRRSQNLPALSINWAAWAEKGMSFKYNHSQFLDAVGMSTIALKDGIEILNYLLSTNFASTIVFKVAWSKFFKVNAAAKKLSFFEKISPKYVLPEDRLLSTQVQLDKNQINNIVLQSLAKLLQLELNEIDPTAPYSNYGLDSIIGINFIAALAEHFSDTVSPMDLYRYPTVSQLVDYIAKSYQASESSNKPIVKKQIVEDIDHLTEAEINKLIEDELVGLDKEIE